MSVQSVISCPDCGSPIYIDSVLLLSGSSFKCTNNSCSVSISLDMSDKGVVEDAMTKFEEIKNASTQQAKASDF